MIKKPKKKPLALNMPFGEALERFVKTDPDEIKTALDKQKELKMPNLTWSKSLSLTDAQQETSGGLVPYLRLTSGDDKRGDYQTWFRDTFFDGVGWATGQYGKEQGIELAQVPMSVTINGLQLSPMVFLISHGPNRQDKNNAPNTWLHWPNALGTILQANDFSGATVKLTRHGQGQYEIEIPA